MTSDTLLLKKQDPLPDTEEDRFIGKIIKPEGPTLVFFGGIHGNEPAGLKAIQHVFSTLEGNQERYKGSLFGIHGNIPAGTIGKRFVEQDLNRLWTTKEISRITGKEKASRTTEEIELVELYSIIKKVLSLGSPPFYFFDLHTTSSPTAPFITINDALINRDFSKQFPVPVILGIEEFLEGPLLSYINALGYVSLGFESGQHNDPEAVQAAIAFMWLTLVYTGFMKDDGHRIHERFSAELGSMVKESIGNFYEVTHKHQIEPGDKYQMIEGFESFGDVAKGTILAEHNGKVVFTKKKAVLFMPLYQAQGKEGFFLIRKIPIWALWISRIVRKLRLENLLLLLPGVTRSRNRKEQLLVNTRIARFFTKPFFHILGYRNRELAEDRILLNSRERVARTKDYRKTSWFRPGA
ncbi:succinylglutamate desuccinylase/aspartoacylase family protein [Poritiphilus flavus]|uniref:Aspartoacylase n=1 Tax=Poritiphilus flavus TaxID=2697053 RepID=A0A6L9E8E9_9FLAO|nr:succinylglutamate desuccinylase/aspartoacylase family protein [Poritiphilus flavus]NAS11035.1 aspartoacylase [Poritiphilus flavus]